MIRCEACGTENSPGAKYCSKCARKLDVATRQAVAERRAGHTATGIRWTSVILAIIIVLLIIGLVAFAVIHGL